MNHFSLDGITACIFLDDRYTKTNNLFSVKYRIIYKRKILYLNSGIALSQLDWKNLNDTRDKKLLEKRTLIQHGYDEITTQIKNIYFKGQSFHLDMLKEKKVKQGDTDVFIHFERKIIKLKGEDRIGSASSYNCALKSYKKFYKKKSLDIYNITPENLNKYENWMIEQGNSYTAVGIYARQLRAIINEIRNLNPELEYNYPFGKGKYEIPTGDSRKKALTLIQIKSIIDFPFEEMSKADLSRDLWIFSYLCNGMNIYDICKLQYSNIFDGEIIYIRQKTKNTSRRKKSIHITLLPYIAKIISKWGVKEQTKTDYIFPFLDEKSNSIKERQIVQNLTRLINSYIQKMSADLGFGKISTYSARHSFASVLKRAGGNIYHIQESLGHGDVKTTENYLASLEKEERIKNANLLLNFK